MIAIVRTPSTQQSNRVSQDSLLEYSHFRKILKTRQKFPTSADSKKRKEEPIQIKRSSRGPVKIDIYTIKTDPDHIKNKKLRILSTTPQSITNQFNTKNANTQTNTYQYTIENKFPVKNLRIKSDIYSSDHLQRNRKPTGPSSCLETIYMAKLRIEQDTLINPNKESKLQQISNVLEKDLIFDSYKYKSQGYALNKWARSLNSSQHCQRIEQVGLSKLLKQTLNTNIEDLKKSIQPILTSSQSIQTEMPEKSVFYKFDSRQNSNKQLYINRGQCVQQLKNNYHFLNKPIIGNRILISLNYYKDDQNISYKQFVHFLKIYCYNNFNYYQQKIEAILSFFLLGDQILTIDFINLIRIICDQFLINHPNTYSLFESIIQNLEIANVLSENSQQQINQDQLKIFFTSGQMRIQDMIDLLID